MNEVKFFTPVVFDPKRRSVGEFLVEKVDGYFSLSGKRAFVIPGRIINHSNEVKLKDYDQSAISKVIFGALKIASYVTLVIPLLMLLSKLTLRNIYSFHLIETILRAPLYPDKSIDVFGDIHGELDGFQEDLTEAGIIDASKDWKAGCTATAIQMGDVIDRGPKSRASYDYLDRLQVQARSHGGQLIRLLGNHELMLLQNHYIYALPALGSVAECEDLRKKLITDIQNGKVQLAWTDGTRLYLHAGLRSKIARQLKTEIGDSKKGFCWAVLGKIFGSKDEDVSYVELTERMNEILKDAVIRNDFSHPVFQVGRSRGGDAEIGGVLWEDVDQLMRSRRARDIPQVIAHNPPRRLGDALIRATDSMRLINVDAGMCQVYGGNRAFVHFQNNRVFIHEKHRIQEKCRASFIDLILLRGWWITSTAEVWQAREVLDPFGARPRIPT